MKKAYIIHWVRLALLALVVGAMLLVAVVRHHESGPPPLPPVVKPPVADGGGAVIETPPKVSRPVAPRARRYHRRPAYRVCYPDVNLCWTQACYSNGTCVWLWS